MQVAVLLLLVLTLLLASVLLFVLKLKKPVRVYKPKGQYLLSAGEKRFFDALLTSAPPYLYVCPKVRIADLVETKLSPTDPNYWKTIAPMNQKHVDFVLVNKLDFAPRLIIELDGGSHTDKLRAARDTFVNSVFQSAGIPILHIPVKHFYSYHDIRETIEKTIDLSSQ